MRALAAILAVLVASGCLDKPAPPGTDDGRPVDAVAGDAVDPFQFCPPGYSATGAGRYRIEPLGNSWGMADQDCRDDVAPATSYVHTHLAVLDSWSELQGLGAPLLAAGVTNVWIGLRHDESLVYQWVAAQATTIDLAAPGVWGTDEPDPSSLCVVIESDTRTLWDEPCASAFSYLCECDPLVSQAARLMP